MVDDIEGLWEDPDYLGPPLEAWRWHKTLGAGGQGVALLYRRIDPATNVTQAVSLVPFSRVFPKIRKKKKSRTRHPGKPGPSVEPAAHHAFCEHFVTYTQFSISLSKLRLVDIES